MLRNLSRALLLTSSAGLALSCLKRAPTASVEQSGQPPQAEVACPLNLEGAKTEEEKLLAKAAASARADEQALTNAPVDDGFFCRDFSQSVDYDWNATGFSAANSALLGEASFLAYQDLDPMARRAREWAGRNAKVEVEHITEPSTDTQLYVVWSTATNPGERGFAFVIFRGTSSKRDFLTDARGIKVGGRSPVWGTVHAGFLSAFQSVRPRLMAKLRDIGGLCIAPDGLTVVPGCQPERRLVITGHSLGAALATLHAADLTVQEVAANNPQMAEKLLKHPEETGDGAQSCEAFQPGGARGLPVVSPKIVHSIYTFGSPRVGNRHFAKCYTAALDARHFRVDYAQDVVSRVPNLGYLHVGTNFFHYSGGKRPGSPVRFQQLVSDGQRQGRIANVIGEFCATMKETIAALASAIANRGEVLVSDHLAYPAPLRNHVLPSCPSARK